VSFLKRMLSKYLSVFSIHSQVRCALLPLVPSALLRSKYWAQWAHL
jgi:hypothetical protein